jgi:hypothetical protein
VPAVALEDAAAQIFQRFSFESNAAGFPDHC